MKPRFLALWCIIWPAFCCGGIAQAAPQHLEQQDDKGILNVVVENDLFAGTDSNYTNGIRFAWLSPEENVPAFARWTADHLLPIDTRQGSQRVSIALGQSMFTPDDLSRRDLIAGDRPYAGWLYGTVGVVSDSGDELDNMALTLGVIGPNSFAEQTQKAVHDVINSPYPYGWHNQLKNEPGVVLTYEHKWRGMYELSPFGAGLDFTPHLGFNLGNVYTDASLGATFRLGYDLPADYGPPRIRPSLPGSDFFLPTQELGGYLFAGLEARTVGRNIFLDGNTFRDSLSVDKEFLIGSAQLGAALTYGAARLSYTHVFMTREFEGQRDAPQFGAVTLSWRF